MSSINVSAILSSISTMEKELASLRALLSGSAPAPSGKGKVPKVKKERKGTSTPPAAWLGFTKRVSALLSKNGYAGTDLAVGCLQFCKVLKTENPEFTGLVDGDILARRASWTAPPIKARAKKSTPTASVVTASDGEVSAPSGDKPKKERKNPWAGLSPEERAAKVAVMKAGKAAKKDAAPATTVSNAAATSSTTLPPLPKSPTTSVKSNEELAGFKKMTLNNKAYWVNLADGRCYNRKADDSRGDWAGKFSKTPKPTIDASAREPEPDFFALLDEM